MNTRFTIDASLLSTNQPRVGFAYIDVDARVPTVVSNNLPGSAHYVQTLLSHLRAAHGQCTLCSAHKIRLATHNTRIVSCISCAWTTSQCPRTHYHINSMCYYSVASTSRKRRLPSSDDEHYSKWTRLEMQALPYMAGVFTDSTVMDSVNIVANMLDGVLGDEGRLHKSFTSNFVKMDDKQDYLCKLIEDVGILFHALLDAHGRVGRTRAMVTYLKARGSNVTMSVICSLATMLVGGLFSPSGDTMQADFDLEAALNVAKSYSDSYTTLKDLPIFRKLYKFAVYLLSFGVFEFFKIKPKAQTLINITDEVMKKDFSSTPDFVHCLIDTLIFLCSLGVQCVKAGSFSPVMHTIDSYGSWADKCGKIVALSGHTSTLRAHGTTIHQYIADLKELIVQGENFIKFKRLDKIEKRALQQQVNKLREIDANILTRKAAMGRRKAPLGVLISGATSIGKSQVQDILYAHHCAVRGLDPASHNRYNRTPGSDYWDGFSSSMHSCVVDDAGQMNPNLGLDPSVGEFIQMMNNVGFVPNQASLEDKGRTPFLCEYVSSTTNTMHLNAKSYFSYPIAAARRFFTIQVDLKDEFQDSRGMLDKSKVKCGECSYLDLWVITVMLPQDDGQHNAKFVPTEQFTSMAQFLMYFTKVILDHNISQEKALTASEDSVTVDRCKCCYLPIAMCLCRNGDDVDKYIANALDSSSEDDLEDARETIFSSLPQNSFAPDKLPGFSTTVRSSESCVNEFWFKRNHSIVKKIDPPASFTYKLISLDDMYRFYLTRDVGSKTWFMHAKGCAVYDHNTVTWKVVKKTPRHMNAQASWYETVRGDALEYLEERLSVLCRNCENQQDHFCFYQQSNVSFWDSPEYNVEDEDKRLMSHATLGFKLRVYVYWMCVEWAYTSWFFTIFAHFFLGTHWRLKLAKSWFSDSESLGFVARAIGHRVQHSIGFTSYFAKVSILFVTGLIALKAYSAIISKFTAQEKRSVFDGFVHDESQGNYNSTSRVPADKDTEKTRPIYHNPSVILTGAELTNVSKCATPNSTVKFDYIVSDNLVFADMNTQQNQQGLGTRTNMFHLSSQVWVINRHTLPNFSMFYLSITKTSSQVGPNMKDILVTKGMIHIEDDSDIAYILLRDYAPLRDVVPYFTQDLPNIRWEGTYMHRDREGTLKMFPARNIQRMYNPIITKDGMGRPVSHTGAVWGSMLDAPTFNGMCGSPLTVCNEAGAVILGIHAAGKDNYAATLYITRSQIARALKHFGVCVINKGTIPISSQSVTRTLGALHPKSPLTFIEEATVDVYGSFEGFRAKPQSKVVKTTMNDALQKAGYEDKWTAPPMDWRPLRASLLEMTSPAVSFNKDILDICVGLMSHHLISNLDDDAKSRIHPFDIDTAVNGKDGLLYCDGLNRQTSAGAPYKCTKSKFLIPREGSDKVNLHPEILDRMDMMVQSYLSGERFHAQFCSHLKDQALTHAKAAKGKTRVFCALELAASVLVRQMLLCIPMSVQNNRFVWCAMPGTVAQSLEWEEIWEFLTQHGPNRIIAGDFAWFDKKVPAAVVLAAFEVIKNLCRHCGYSDEEILIVNGLAHDICFPTTDFGGDLLQFLGTNPSGHPLTVIINGIVNVLYMLYCWQHLSPLEERDNFFSLVAMASYGDDNVMGVSENAPWFTHTSIQRELANVGIEYTMADKETQSVPYIHIDDCSFLKRSWRWDSDVGAMLAPLEEASIIKSLMICTASRTISARQRDIAAVSSAVREYFFYGREVYEAKVCFLQDIVSCSGSAAYVESTTFPSWSSLYDQFWENSKHVTLSRRQARKSTV